MAVAWKLCYSNAPLARTACPLIWSASFISGSFHVNEVVITMRLGLDSRDISRDARMEGNLISC
jgi:hypothetical protein